MADKPAGKTFNVKKKVIAEDGTVTWKMHGRVFVRADLSGGAVWLGEGEEEQEYALFPKDGKPKGVSAAPVARPSGPVSGS